MINYYSEFQGARFPAIDEINGRTLIAIRYYRSKLADFTARLAAGK
jgi:hypothetical protein